MPHEDQPEFWNQPECILHTQLLLDSFERWLRRDLLPRTGSLADQARALFEAPFVVVSHGTQADPILNYGNAAALALWETDLPTLCATPSRLTAEPMHRDERARLLERTTRDGYVDDYRGIRISRTGRRFQIDQAIVWNLIDHHGQYAGQAATFSAWTYL
ncbi:MAG: MEKHLA domain-containing protein [Planctomycetales bacterium]